MNQEFDKWSAEDVLYARLDRYRQALETIAQGAGRFDPDPYQHAMNTIEDAVRTAQEALKDE